MLTIATPFDEESVDLILDLGIDILSNGAFCLMNGSSYHNKKYEV